ncbi:MAG: tape measure protein, partial [Phocaeicola sp.]
PEIVPVQWESSGVDVFTTSGYERFQQEVQSTNDMLNTLNQTQAQIEQTASGIDILPDAAIQDINGMGQRLQAIQQRIQQIENNPVNLGTDTANAELEQLRSQLNTAIQEQNELNQAMQNMDVSAANDAYLRLSQTVSGTERYIRDNVDEQGRFNQEIRAGTIEADNLMDTIKGVVAAYVSIQSVGSVLNISDELASTTARLNLMNDNLQTTQELENMIYAAAQDARGSFGDMAASVAKLGNLAGDAFDSSAEIVAFAEQLNKQMKLSGASTQEASSAMLQLTQSLAKGTLNGDELTSVMENGSMVVQTIADYMGVAQGEIKDLAAEGQITSDIIVAAMLGATDETNAAFESLPMTWADVWQNMKNGALVAFRPVLQRINDFANSTAVQDFVNGAVQALAVLAAIALDVIDFMESGAAFISENWSIIAPIVYGIVGALAAYVAISTIVAVVNGIMATAAAVHAAAEMMQAGATFAATAAQYGLNAALMACPLTWIILLIIALIAIIFAVCSAIAKLTGVANSGFGVITGGINVVIQFFKNLGLTVANIALGIGNAIAALGSNIMTAFHNAICSVQAWWYDLLSTVLNVVAGICEALNKLPFVEFDYSGITSAADEYAAKSAEAAGNKEDYTSISDAFNDGFSTFDTFQDGWAADAFDAGASWGDGVADAVSNFSLSDVFGSTDIPNVSDYTSGFSDAIANAGIGDNLGNIAGDTGAIKDSMDITQEELKYMRDIAERDIIDKYTLAEVHIEQNNTNTINSGDDIDGFMTKLTDSVNEAVDNMTEGVHD